MDPYACLPDVLTRLPAHPPTRPAELTPRGWQAVRVAAAAPATTSS